MIPHTLACTSTQLHSSSLVAQGRAVLGKLPAPPPPRPLAPTHSSSSDVHQWEGRRVSPLSLSQGLRAHTPVSRRPLDRSLTLTTPTGAHAPPPPHTTAPAILRPRCFHNTRRARKATITPPPARTKEATPSLRAPNNQQDPLPFPTPFWRAPSVRALMAPFHTPHARTSLSASTDLSFTAHCYAPSRGRAHTHSDLLPRSHPELPTMI